MRLNSGVFNKLGPNLIGPSGVSPKMRKISATKPNLNHWCGHEPQAVGCLLFIQLHIKGERHTRGYHKCLKKKSVVYSSSLQIN